MAKVTFGTPREDGSFGNEAQTQGGTTTSIFLDGAKTGYIERYMAFGWKPFTSAYIVWWGLVEPNGEFTATTSERWFNTHGSSGDVYPSARSALAAAKRYARETLIQGRS